MAKINRFTGDLEAFASNATALNRTLFGDTAQANDLDSNINTEYKAGWETVAPTASPPKNWFNAFAYTTTLLHSYIHQMGIPEWDSLQQFYIGSITNQGGVLYKSLINTNINNDPSIDDGTNWALAASPDKTTESGTGTITVLSSENNKTFLADASGGAVTVDLPAISSVTNGFEVTIKKTDSSINSVTIDGNALETIDGNTTRILYGQYNWIRIISDGTQWNINGLECINKFLMGDWNMFTTQTINIIHNMDHTKILGGSGYVRDDTDTNRLIAATVNGGTGAVDWGISFWDSTNIQLARLLGGGTNSAAFDSTSYNRGELFIHYNP